MKKELLRRKILMMLLGAILSVGAFAQQVVLRGVVTSADDGQPLPGVAVVEKGTINGTVTDIDGNYQLSVPSNAVVVYSFVGMKGQEMALEGRTQINVQLEADLYDVEEVVVVGYGVQKKH